MAVVRTNVSEEHIASIIRLETISELGTTLAVTVLQLLVSAVPCSLILSNLMVEARRSSETFVLRRATRRHTPKTALLIGTAVKTSDLTRA
jgi:hypothetical protein